MLLRAFPGVVAFYPTEVALTFASFSHSGGFVLVFEDLDVGVVGLSSVSLGLSDAKLFLATPCFVVPWDWDGSAEVEVFELPLKFCLFAQVLQVLGDVLDSCHNSGCEPWVGLVVFFLYGWAYFRWEFSEELVG